MLPGKNAFSAPTVTSEGPFPLGPFPRHIWIHNNTPQDSLDETCHEIWKRVQRLSEELQPPSLVPPLQPALCPDLSGTLRRDSINSQSNNYLLDEPEGLESIYRAMIGNREREMKLRALCDAQLSAKSVITSLLCSAKSHKNSKRLEDGRVTGARKMEGSKLEMPFLLKYTDTAKGAGNQVTADETKIVKEFIQNSMFSSAKSSTAGSSTTTAESQATGQKQQLPPFAKICSKTDSDAVTKNPVTTAPLDKKNIKYNASTSGCSTTSMTTALNQPVWQSLNFPPLPTFPNHSNFPQFQGPYHQRARIPYQQALHPSFGCYSRQLYKIGRNHCVCLKKYFPQLQFPCMGLLPCHYSRPTFFFFKIRMLFLFPPQVAPYSPQQIFQPPYTPMLNYITLVQPGYPYQQRTPPTLSSNIPDLSPMAGDGIQYPFSPSYGYGHADLLSIFSVL
ncbi:uncharacterized protein C1orf94 homolog [Calonectris borealis]|uniref:uncharacterized protein C1orf94 homolog n=1 Tax=Calonectris borealis TaxID=1323832 RepID=UPI003F4C8EF2